MQNCYNKEAVDQQNQRLTKAHIETLGFVQDLARDNRDLKQQLQALEKQLGECEHLHHAAKAAEKRLEELEKRCQLKMKERDEKYAENLSSREKQYALAKEAWSNELDTTRNQVAMQQQTIERLTQEMVEKKSESYHKDLTSSEHFEKEIQRYIEENRNLQVELSTQQRRTSRCEQLEENVRVVEQKRVELELKVKQVTLQLNEAVEAETSCREVITKQQHRIQQLNRECAPLRDELAALYAEVEAHKKESDMFGQETNLLREEIQHLRLTLANVTVKPPNKCSAIAPLQTEVNFKDFVLLKREFSSLKDENETLKERILLLTSKNSISTTKLKLPSLSSNHATQADEQKVAKNLIRIDRKMSSSSSTTSKFLSSNQMTLNYHHVEKSSL